MYLRVPRVIFLISSCLPRSPWNAQLAFLYPHTYCPQGRGHIRLFCTILLTSLLQRPRPSSARCPSSAEADPLTLSLSLARNAISPSLHLCPSPHWPGQLLPTLQALAQGQFFKQGFPGPCTCRRAGSSCPAPTWHLLRWTLLRFWWNRCMWGTAVPLAWWENPRGKERVFLALHFVRCACQGPGAESAFDK